MISHTVNRPARYAAILHQSSAIHSAHKPRSSRSLQRPPRKLRFDTCVMVALSVKLSQSEEMKAKSHNLGITTRTPNAASRAIAALNCHSLLATGHCAPLTARMSNRNSTTSNRNTPELESDLSTSKQTRKDFLIATACCDYAARPGRRSGRAKRAMLGQHLASRRSNSREASPEKTFPYSIHLSSKKRAFLLRDQQHDQKLLDTLFRCSGKELLPKN